MSKITLNVIQLNTVDSTNNYAKALLRSGELLTPYTLIYAENQTAGRGRLGRSWHSKEGDTLCLSLVVPYPNAPAITLLAAVGVRRALAELCKESIRIKWPNDLIFENKKLCGILTESTDKAAVIGIGINLNSTEFPQDIAHKAASLRLMTKRSFEPLATAEKVARSVAEVLELTKGKLTPEILGEYTQLCENIGREIEFGGKKGVATAISCDGALVVTTDAGTELVSSGEVTVSGIY